MKYLKKFPRIGSIILESKVSLPKKTTTEELRQFYYSHNVTYFKDLKKK